MGESKQTRLLFFARNDQPCHNFYSMHVKKYAPYTYILDLTNPTSDAIETAKNFAIHAVPCLILLDIDGYEIKRWQGGIIPDSNFISVEIGMGDAWRNQGG